jgi:hypothetical protein
VRALVVLPILAVLSFASSVLADPPPGTIMKVTPPAPNAMSMPEKICAMQMERNTAMLGQLEKTLVLTDKQKPLFDAWMNTRKEVMHAWPCPAPSTGIDVPTPTRMDRQEKMLSMEVDALRRERPLIAALYEALTPEQRQTFDGPAPKSQQPMPQPAPAQAKPGTPPAH